MILNHVALLIFSEQRLFEKHYIFNGNAWKMWPSAVYLEFLYSVVSETVLYSPMLNNFRNNCRVKSFIYSDEEIMQVNFIYEVA